MNTTFQVLPATDALMDRYNELAFRQNIPDIEQYARDWYELAESAAQQNRPALAGMCLSRAKFYGFDLTGEFVRLIDGSFSELVPAG